MESRAATRPVVTEASDERSTRQSFGALANRRPDEAAARKSAGFHGANGSGSTEHLNQIVCRELPRTSNGARESPDVGTVRLDHRVSELQAVQIDLVRLAHVGTPSPAGVRTMFARRGSFAPRSDRSLLARRGAARPAGRSAAAAKDRNPCRPGSRRPSPLVAWHVRASALSGRDPALRSRRRASRRRTVVPSGSCF